MTSGIGKTPDTGGAADVGRGHAAGNSPRLNDICRTDGSEEIRGVCANRGADFNELLEIHLQEAERMQAEAQQAIEQVSKAPRAPVGNVLAASRQATAAYDMLASARDEMMQAYAKLAEHKRG